MARRSVGWAVILLAVTLLAPQAIAAGEKPTAAGQREASRPKSVAYVWRPELAPKGPIVMFISLKDQQAFIYRSGVRIGATRVSTGRKGYETPVGVFEVVQKQVMHHSNLYDDAPMPFMQRLTWDGLALHAGQVPGRPASHGCVRLPAELAKALYGLPTLGMTVIIADQAPGPDQLEAKTYLAPIGPLRLPDRPSRLAHAATDPPAPRLALVDPVGPKSAARSADEAGRLAAATASPDP